MTELQQKQLALLDETVKLYTLKNRSVYKGDCRYFSEKTQGCAIGRKIEDKELCKKLDDLTINIPSFVFSDAFKMFPEDLQKLGWAFLEKIQELHDQAWNWSDNGISFRGEQKVDRIKREFHLLTN